LAQVADAQSGAVTHVRNYRASEWMACKRTTMRQVAAIRQLNAIAPEAARGHLTIKEDDSFAPDTVTLTRTEL